MLEARSFSSNLKILASKLPSSDLQAPASASNLQRLDIDTLRRARKSLTAPVPG